LVVFGCGRAALRRIADTEDGRFNSTLAPSGLARRLFVSIGSLFFGPRISEPVFDSREK
jgi:hypothetical protein